LPIEIKSETTKKLDRKIINEFTMIVESNIGNENLPLMIFAPGLAYRSYNCIER